MLWEHFTAIVQSKPHDAMVYSCSTIFVNSNDWQYLICAQSHFAWCIVVSYFQVKSSVKFIRLNCDD